MRKSSTTGEPPADAPLSGRIHVPLVQPTRCSSAHAQNHATHHLDICRTNG